MGVNRRNPEGSGFDAASDIDPDLVDARPAVRSTRPAHRDVRLLALVWAGGAIGTLIRFLVEAALPPSATGWPWATFLINLTGSFALGFLLEFLARRGPDTGWRRGVRLTRRHRCARRLHHVQHVRRRGRPADPGERRTLVGPAYALACLVLGPLAAAAGYVLARRSGPTRIPARLTVIVVLLSLPAGSARRPGSRRRVIARHHRLPFPLGTLVDQRDRIAAARLADRLDLLPPRATRGAGPEKPCWALDSAAATRPSARRRWRRFDSGPRTVRPAAPVTPSAPCSARSRPLRSASGSAGCSDPVVRSAGSTTRRDTARVRPADLLRSLPIGTRVVVRHRVLGGFSDALGTLLAAATSTAWCRPDAARSPSTGRCRRRQAGAPAADAAPGGNGPGSRTVTTRGGPTRQHSTSPRDGSTDGDLHPRVLRSSPPGARSPAAARPVRHRQATGRC